MSPLFLFSCYLELIPSFHLLLLLYIIISVDSIHLWLLVLYYMHIVDCLRSNLQLEILGCFFFLFLSLYFHCTVKTNLVREWPYKTLLFIG